MQINFAELINMALPWLTSALMGIVVAGITEAVKAIRSIPINQGQRSRILTFVGIVAMVANLAKMVFTGEFDNPAVVQSYAELIVKAAITWLGAHASYHGLIKEPSE